MDRCQWMIGRWTDCRVILSFEIKEPLHSRFFFWLLSTDIVEREMESNQTIIANGFVTWYADHFVIHWCCFPFGKKKVKYCGIRFCELPETKDRGMLEQKLWDMPLSLI